MQSHAHCSSDPDCSAEVSPVLFAPASQVLIQAFGWMVALWTLALATLGAIPLARAIGDRSAAGGKQKDDGARAWPAIREAFLAPFFLCP